MRFTLAGDDRLLRDSLSRILMGNFTAVVRRPTVRRMCRIPASQRALFLLIRQDRNVKFSWHRSSTE